MLIRKFNIRRNSRTQVWANVEELDLVRDSDKIYNTLDSLSSEFRIGISALSEFSPLSTRVYKITQPSLQYGLPIVVVIGQRKDGEYEANEADILIALDWFAVGHTPNHLNAFRWISHYAFTDLKLDRLNLEVENGNTGAEKVMVESFGFV